MIKKFFPFFKNTGKILGTTFGEFNTDRGLKLSASLAYYTIFSLAPLLVLVISSAGLILGQKAIQGTLFSQINRFVGNQAAIQIQEVIKNVTLSGKSFIGIVIGVIVLIVGASGVFTEIQDSINMIWGVQIKPKKNGVIKFLLNRVLSFSMILSLSFLLIVSLIVNGLLTAVGNQIGHFLPFVTIHLIQLLNLAISLSVNTLLFAFIFKVLPDVLMKWKDVIIGAFFTTLLFLIGQFAIGRYIAYSKTGVIFGAAGSLIVILVWVYYTAAIIYLGAEFTKVYCHFKGRDIVPSMYAETVRTTVVRPDNLKGDEKNDTGAP